LQVEIAEQKVIARHVAHERQDYSLLCVPGAQKLSSGCFCFAPSATSKTAKVDSKCKTVERTIA
jgi:hypothetical protein